MFNTDGTITVEQKGSGKANANIGVANMATGNSHTITCNGCFRV